MTDRPQLLNGVRDGLAAAVAPDFEAAGFSFRRRGATFHRERDGVALEFRLAISSRPASMGYEGILVGPLIVATVPQWVADAQRRLAASSTPLVSWDRPGPVVHEAFDWLVPGRGPHWTLPDEPTDWDVERVAQSLLSSVREIGLPYLERLASKDRLLADAATGEIDVPETARFTVACGAMSSGRPDLARAIIQPFGTARRESVAETLGLAD